MSEAQRPGERDASYRALSVDEFLDALAAGSPAPAAGSAAALVVAHAAALCAKAARLSERQLTAGQAGALTAEAERARAAAAALIDDDARAYRAVIEQRRLPAGPARTAGVAAALSAAADVPVRIVELAAVIAALAASLAARGNPALRGDAATAALLAEAGGRSAAALAAINLAGSPDDPRLRRAGALLAAIAESAGAATVAG